METIGTFNPRIHLLLILAAAGFFIFWGSHSDLLDPDQGMFASIAEEMVKGKDWITPHFDGVRYLEKPPLYYWLTAFLLLLFGPSEWAVRLGSALPALGTALLTYRLGQMFYGVRGALLSALVMIGSLGVMRYARQPAPDFVFVFSITLAMVGFARTFLPAPSASGDGPPATDERRLSLPFYAGMALAVLSKGLIGFVFPVVIAAFYLWLAGERVGWRELNPARGIALFLALVLPWHLLAAWKNPGFFWFYVVDNQFLRFLNRRAYIEEDVRLTTPGFLVNVLIWTFPWSLVLPAALREAVPRRRSMTARAERVRLLVGLWTVTVIGFFCLSFSKLEHYYLPAIVPLSLMAGKVWADALDAPRTATALKWCLGAAAVAGPLLGTGLLVLARRLTPDDVLAGLAQADVYYRIVLIHGHEFPFVSIEPFAALLRMLGILFIASFPLAFVFLTSGFPRIGFATLLTVGGIVGLLVFKLVLVLEPFNSTKAAAHALSARLAPGDRVVYEGDLSYAGGLPFYTGRQFYVLNGRTGDLEFGSHYPEVGGLFLDDASFPRFWTGDGRIFFLTRLPERQSSIRYFTEPPALFVGRYGSYSLYSNRSLAK